jgi:hypothetical protein
MNVPPQSAIALRTHAASIMEFSSGVTLSVPQARGVPERSTTRPTSCPWFIRTITGDGVCQLGTTTKGEQALDTLARDPKSAAASLGAEHRHAASYAGYHIGKLEGVEGEFEDEVVHQISLEALGMARLHAADTGPRGLR